MVFEGSLGGSGGVTERFKLFELSESFDKSWSSRFAFQDVVSDLSDIGHGVSHSLGNHAKFIKLDDVFDSFDCIFGLISALDQVEVDKESSLIVMLDESKKVVSFKFLKILNKRLGFHVRHTVDQDDEVSEFASSLFELAQLDVQHKSGNN